MKWISFSRIDFFKGDKTSLLMSSVGENIQPLTPQNVDAIVAFRDLTIKNQLLSYLQQGREGALYFEETCLAHALIWRRSEKKRLLFGCLKVPKALDFIFFFRGKDSTLEDALKAFVSHFYTMEIPLGISVPRSDGRLRQAIEAVGFTFTHTRLCVTILRFKFSLRWSKGW